MPTVSANQCEMYYEVDDFTDPWITDKETVWLQHGVGRSTKFWYHWIPPLARHYQVIRRDMRGHGQSAAPGPNHRWSLDELVTDMHAFILGVLFATRWPERLKSLTICNSPTTIRPAGTRALSGEQGNLHKLLASEGSVGWGRVMIERKIISGNSPEHIEWVLKEWAKTPAHVLQGITKTLDGADTAPLLPQVSVPTLVLAPANSPITPLTDQLSMRTEIPNARIAIVEGPGHEIYVDRPEECLSALQNFLESL